MKYSIFILGAVFLWSGQMFSQVKSENVFDRLYFKAGAEFYSLKKGSSNIKGDVNDISLVGSVIYDYHDNMQVEFVYKYGFERGYSVYTVGFFTGGENVSIGESESMTDYAVDFKLNYFLNRDKTLNPIYLIGLVEFDLQNRSVRSFESRFDTGSYYQKYYRSDLSTYNRLLVGPGLGAGMFLAFGKINFQAEVNSVFRIAPFVDRGYKELLLNIFSGLAYKF